MKSFRPRVLSARTENSDNSPSQIGDFHKTQPWSEIEKSDMCNRIKPVLSQVGSSLWFSFVRQLPKFYFQLFGWNLVQEVTFWEQWAFWMSMRIMMLSKTESFFLSIYFLAVNYRTAQHILYNYLRTRL